MTLRQHQKKPRILRLSDTSELAVVHIVYGVVNVFRILHTVKIIDGAIENIHHVLHRNISRSAREKL